MTKPTNAEPAHHVYRTRWRLMMDNFLGGVAWGLGSVIGATLVVAVIGLLVAQSQQLPIVGKIIYTIVDSVEQYSQQVEQQTRH